MTIVVRNKETGKYRVYTKGADDVIFERLKKKIDGEAKRQLGIFAKSGLRTLCMATKEISEGKYNTINSHPYRCLFKMGTTIQRCKYIITG